MTYRLHGSALARVLAIGLCLVLGLTLMGSYERTSAASSDLTLAVSASSDDARNPDGGALTTTEKVAQIGAGSGGNANVAGFRFGGVTIPKGAVIESVQLTMVANKTTTSRLVVDCAFETSDNAATFSGASGPAQRAVTSAKQRADRSVQRTGGKRYVICGGAQLVASLQEIVNRGGWASGNAVALIANGPATPSGARVGFRTRDYSAKTAPRLVITYSPPAGGGETPVAGQPCPTWVHDSYKAQGPDGNMYPTWHPPTDPTYGCHFGHEHGDDPTSSPAMKGRKVLFGYASIKAGMNEPHVGFKVSVWNQEKNTHNTPNSHMNAYAVFVIHQGTAGAGRFTTVHHDFEFHYWNPGDGREIHAHVLAPFGDLFVGCGANDPNGTTIDRGSFRGLMQVAADACFNDPKSPYEDWITAIYLGRDANYGGYEAYFDPHFAIFNPNTYCILSNGACTLGYSDVRDNTGADPAGTNSWFKGAKRETYMNQVWVTNAGKSTSLWTDPYGVQVAAGTANAIEQYVSAVNVKPQDPSNAFGADRNHDPDGSVHAPN